MSAIKLVNNESLAKVRISRIALWRHVGLKSRGSGDFNTSPCSSFFILQLPSPSHTRFYRSPALELSFSTVDRPSPRTWTTDRSVSRNTSLSFARKENSRHFSTPHPAPSRILSSARVPVFSLSYISCYRWTIVPSTTRISPMGYRGPCYYLADRDSESR